MGKAQSAIIAVKVTLNQHKVRGIGYGSYLFISSSSPLLPTTVSSNSQQFIGCYLDKGTNYSRLVCTIKCPSRVQTLTDMGQQLPKLRGNAITWLAVARLYQRGRALKMYFPKRTGLEIPSGKVAVMGIVTPVSDRLCLLDIPYR